jgi:ABC-type phosphate transport system substrate-binding protein
MKTLKTWTVIGLCAGLAGATGVGLAPPARADDSGLVVVVGKSNPLNDISRADLRRAFSGEPVNVGGKPLVPFNMAPASAERQTFDKALLGLSADEATKFWIDRRIRGQGSAPKSAPSLDVVGKVVGNFPNAISYVPAAAIPAGVKALTIDGKAPGSPDYLPKK